MRDDIIILRCPHCKASVSLDDCDCMGASTPDSLFCAECGREFNPAAAPATSRSDMPLFGKEDRQC